MGEEKGIGEGGRGWRERKGERKGGREGGIERDVEGGGGE